ncbi:hypothetical protein HDU81_010827 [Chytriomyces hyalinus]|nr:hypothetical protein HDU81_010827 [Chytriomyces hyalinus]
MTHCVCCQKHADYVQSLHQRALEELNFYRKLLQLDPLTSMGAFESSTDAAVDEPTASPESITRSAALGTMPAEILDRIVQFVDDESIMPLCHAMPYYKYISAAMFDFALRFPDEYDTPSELWPDLFLPRIQNSESVLTDFQIQNVHAIGVYSRIVSKHGGTVNVPCAKNVFNFLGTFPDVVSVHPSLDSSRSGWAEFLRGLAEANKRIQSCTVEAVSSGEGWDEVAKQLTRLQIHSLIWIDDDGLPIEVQDALSDITGLTYLEDLKEIAFTRLLPEDSAGLVECILRRIEGSHVQRVWCEKLTAGSLARHVETLDIITADFLQHGWHKETHDDKDEKIAHAVKETHFTIPLSKEHSMTQFLPQTATTGSFDQQDAFESSNVQPASCLKSMTRSAGLETMPPEMLDRIAQFVDSKSILRLCHSMPYFKYISAGF